jgi:hypothetical protein
MGISHLDAALSGLLCLHDLSPAANAAGYTPKPLRGKRQIR